MPAIIQTDSDTFIQRGTVVANRLVCREHFRLILRVPAFEPTSPGQFVHLCPSMEAPATCAETKPGATGWPTVSCQPMLRRAFSVADLQDVGGESEVDVVYRVVGIGTRWMASLSPGDHASVLGPLGNAFPVSADKPNAWLVAGGVGVPPMLFLAAALRDTEHRTIAFCGSRSADLLALTIDGDAPSRGATEATQCTAEFTERGADAVIATDDGTLGFHGHIGAAMVAYHQANPLPPDELVVYTCGPTRMMQFVADYCNERGIECHVCMEQAMACGTGLCQSCVVPVRDEDDADGWRYRLCCTDGPVFEASDIIWTPAGSHPAPQAR